VPRRTLIIGCGYVGRPLAKALQARGDAVTAWVRSAESATELVGEKFERIIIGDVSESGVWHDAGKFDAVVHCASSGGGGVPAYCKVYLWGARQMHAYQAEARRILVSSTSVYGQTDGAWVDESSLTEPAAETSRVLVQTEGEAIATGAIVARAAGIYGPGRAALFEKFRRGDAVIEGDGSRWINQVHLIDIVNALAHLLDAGNPSEIYNVADDEPVMLRDFYAWCSEKLGKPIPPSGPIDPNRKRGLTNKRVSNKKLRAAGWVPHYPTFREGLVDRIS
jgi:nucleoside-diphosphate-sugar epimerase